MKTLIIHPEDESTTVLSEVYKNIENKTVINGSINYAELHFLIKNHDRVIMLGHGSPAGLFSCGMFDGTDGYIINSSVADLLAQKKNSVFIWCHANEFVRKHKLQGIYSGMFISEVQEAFFCGLKHITQKMVDESSDGFFEILGEHINEPQEVAFKIAMDWYGKIALNNPVAMYNWKRMGINV